MSFVRARFCELASTLCGMNPTEQYLLGMLSMLPAMLRSPMDELTPNLPLRDSIREALTGEQIPERMLLCWLEAHEQGEWNRCAKVIHAAGVSDDELMQCYEEALLWAEAAIHTTS